MRAAVQGIPGCFFFPAESRSYYEKLPNGRVNLGRKPWDPPTNARHGRGGHPQN